MLSHHSGHGTYVTFKRFVMGDKEHITLSAKIDNESEAVIKEVTTNLHAIGYLSTIAANQSKVKIIAVNNIFPSLEAITKCQYPICRELYLLARKNCPPEVKQFIDYCLLPNKGQAIIRQAGVAPIG